MNGTAQNTASWTKQCSHCLRLLGEDGRYHDMDLTGPATGFPPVSGEEDGLRITPAICPECFEALRECVAAGEPTGLAVA